VWVGGELPAGAAWVLPLNVSAEIHFSILSVAILSGFGRDQIVLSSAGRLLALRLDVALQPEAAARGGAAQVQGGQRVPCPLQSLSGGFLLCTAPSG